MSSTSDPNKQRQFYLMMAGASVALGLWHIYRLKASGPLWVGAGLLLLIIEFFMPLVARALFRGWMTFAKILGTVNTYLIVSVIFFVMIVPIGLARRMTTKSFRASLKKCRETKTAWTALSGTVPTVQSYSNPY